MRVASYPLLLQVFGNDQNSPYHHFVIAQFPINLRATQVYDCSPTDPLARSTASCPKWSRTELREEMAAFCAAAKTGDARGSFREQWRDLATPEGQPRHPVI